ncbi:MAG TPA: dTDP-4-dehydrorhamnose 3,5-epimerase [Saprospiraceae bacterium]|nr:dTDP-4-dehydrorhamnose 3,5-epimerase [Saprospiraceae bacterium]HQW56316.1 dTDP-4-dehydrorhamnose 3,5-epimerase [Saprospiraceae bacterium]
MKVIETPISGLILFAPAVYEDDRGYFFESFRASFFESLGLHRAFIQDNQAYSLRGTLRGLHFQTGSTAQAKLVRVPYGEVLDVAVDLRPDSATLGEHYAVRLNDINHLQLYVPAGFAHGYLVLSESAVFAYKCDNYYAPGTEDGIRYDDTLLNINWGLSPEELIISPKDRALSSFAEYKSNLNKNL